MNEEPRQIFKKRLLNWWKKNKRDFQWRHTSDPYAVLVAEMLLRKTTSLQVDRLYGVLIKQYPDVRSLEEADESALRNMIEPLGMEYKRAKLLKDVSKVIFERYGGKMPSEQKELMKLPGVGRYATNAVLSFCYAKNVPMVDTNYIRIIERVFGFKSSKKRARDDKRIWEFAERLIPKGRSKEFNLAVIDFAALVCRVHVPKCEICSLSSICVFFNESLEYE